MIAYSFDYAYFVNNYWYVYNKAVTATGAIVGINKINS